MDASLGSTLLNFSSEEIISEKYLKRRYIQTIENYFMENIYLLQISCQNFLKKPILQKGCFLL